MRVLFLHHRGSKLGVLGRYIDFLHNHPQRDFTAKKVRLDEAMGRYFDPKGYDVLIYHTFPDSSQQGKFNPVLTLHSDKFFLSWPGPKVLYDSHEEGDMDAYSRFLSDQEFYVIKYLPGKGYMQDKDPEKVLVVPFANIAQSSRLARFLNLAIKDHKGASMEQISS